MLMVTSVKLAVIFCSTVFCFTNQQRIEHHLPALTANRALHNTAQEWANEIATTGNVIHGNFVARIGGAYHNWLMIGENIAEGFPDPNSAVQAWIHSKDHCQNILDPLFRNIGIGNVGNIWVEDFGVKQNQKFLSYNYRPYNHCPF